MPYSHDRAIELYELKAQNFDPETAPNQRKFYQDAAEWLKAHRFNTQDEATAAMQNTPYYLGGVIALALDDADLRIKAMDEVGYNDVAALHRHRRQRIEREGNTYIYGQDWTADLNRAQEICNEYARRKEVFGRIFSGYISLMGNPLERHRQEAAEQIAKGLNDLAGMGLDFFKLAGEQAYFKLTMTTPQGMQNFVKFIAEFKNSRGQNAARLVKMTGTYEEDVDELVAWANQNKSALIEVGKSEVWKRANCVAVPSKAPRGYDFMALKEMED